MSRHPRYNVNASYHSEREGESGDDVENWDVDQVEVFGKGRNLFERHHAFVWSDSDFEGATDDIQPGRPRSPRLHCRSRSSPPRGSHGTLKKRPRTGLRQRFFGKKRSKAALNADGEERRVLPASEEASELCDSDDHASKHAVSESPESEESDRGWWSTWGERGSVPNRGTPQPRGRMKFPKIFPRARNGGARVRRTRSAERAIVHAQQRIQKGEVQVSKIMSKATRLMSTAEKVHHRLRHMKPRWGTVNFSQRARPQKFERANSTRALSAERMRVLEKRRELKKALDALGEVPTHSPGRQGPERNSENDKAPLREPPRKASPEPPMKVQDMEIQAPFLSSSTSDIDASTSDAEGSGCVSEEIEEELGETDHETGSDNSSEIDEASEQPSNVAAPMPSHTNWEHRHAIAYLDGLLRGGPESPPPGHLDGLLRGGPESPLPGHHGGDKADSVAAADSIVAEADSFLTYPTTPSRAYHLDATTDSDDTQSTIDINSDADDGLEIPSTDSDSASSMSTSETHAAEEKTSEVPGDFNTSKGDDEQEKSEDNETRDKPTRLQSLADLQPPKPSPVMTGGKRSRRRSKPVVLDSKVLGDKNGRTTGNESDTSSYHAALQGRKRMRPDISRRMLETPPEHNGDAQKEYLAHSDINGRTLHISASAHVEFGNNSSSGRNEKRSGRNSSGGQSQTVPMPTHFVAATPSPAGPPQVAPPVKPKHHSRGDFTFVKQQHGAGFMSGSNSFNQDSGPADARGTPNTFRPLQGPAGGINNSFRPNQRIAGGAPHPSAPSPPGGGRYPHIVPGAPGANHGEEVPAAGNNNGEEALKLEKIQELIAVEDAIEREVWRNDDFGGLVVGLRQRHEDLGAALSKFASVVKDEKKHKKAVLKHLDDAPMLHENWCHMITGEASMERDQNGGKSIGRRTSGSRSDSARYAEHDAINGLDDILLLIEKAMRCLGVQKRFLRDRQNKLANKQEAIDRTIRFLNKKAKQIREGFFTGSKSDQIRRRCRAVGLELDLMEVNQLEQASFNLKCQIVALIPELEEHEYTITAAAREYAQQQIVKQAAAVHHSRFTKTVGDVQLEQIEHYDHFGPDGVPKRGTKEGPMVI